MGRSRARPSGVYEDRATTRRPRRSAIGAPEPCEIARYRAIFERIGHEPSEVGMSGDKVGAFSLFNSTGATAEQLALGYFVEPAGVPSGRVTSRSEIELAARLNRLHQLLYMRGGIRPVNAAIEELAKLVLLRVAADQIKDFAVGKWSLRDLLDPRTVRGLTSVEPLKEAFANVIALPSLAARVPGGASQPVWPLDEPLRISRLDVLAEAIDIISDLDFTAGNGSLDPLGVAFDVFLQGRYDHSGGLGTYLTPTPVTSAMTRIGIALVDPLKDWSGGPVVGDPCCGTGRFVVSILEELQGNPVALANPAMYARFRDEGAMGADQSTSAVAKARVNLLALGVRNPEVFTVDDSITDPSLDRLRGCMKLILTNPPFGEGKYDSPEGIRRTTAFFPGLSGRRRIDPALAFVARCVDLLAEGGVAGIILPDGIADGSALKEAALFAVPKTQISIEAVVSLPTATFGMAGTTAKTTALFIRRGRPKCPRVFVARCDHIGYLKQGGSMIADPDGDDLPAITRLAVKQIASAPASVSTDLLSESPVAAALDRDGLTTIDPGALDPKALRARRDIYLQKGVPLTHFLRPRKARRIKPTRDLPFVSVLHVDDFGVIDWMGVQDYHPSTPGIVANAGDLIISMLNPRKFRASVIPARYRQVECSAEFGVFATTENPYGVLALLQDPRVRAQFAPLGRGTSSSRRRIDFNDVLSILVPKRDRDWFETAGKATENAIDSIAQARQSLAQLYSPGETSAT